MYYLIDTKTNKAIVKSENKGELKQLIKRLYTYQNWAIVYSEGKQFPSTQQLKH